MGSPHRRKTHMGHPTHPKKLVNPDGAIENAKALLHVANHLDADLDTKRTEALLFHGLILAIPTLLGLATELALKGLLMREVGAAPQSHDLIELFDQLPERTRRRLEEKMPGVPPVHPQLPSVFPGIREVLEENRTLFVEWRYLHERFHATTETSVLKEALSAIIDTFEEPKPPPGPSPPDARGS